MKKEAGSHLKKKSNLTHHHNESSHEINNRTFHRSHKIKTESDVKDKDLRMSQNIIRGASNKVKSIEFNTKKTTFKPRTTKNEKQAVNILIDNDEEAALIKPKDKSQGMLKKAYASNTFKRGIDVNHLIKDQRNQTNSSF